MMPVTACNILGTTDDNALGNPINSHSPVKYIKTIQRPARQEEKIIYNVFLSLFTSLPIYPATKPSPPLAINVIGTKMA